METITAHYVQRKTTSTGIQVWMFWNTQSLRKAYLFNTQDGADCDYFAHEDIWECDFPDTRLRIGKWLWHMPVGSQSVLPAPIQLSVEKDDVWTVYGIEGIAIDGFNLPIDTP